MNALSNYSISQKEFKKFQELIYNQSGISLADSKQSMLLARLVKRVRALKMEDLSSYYDYVTKGTNKAELGTLLDLVSTNKTFFFREMHHFEFLKQRIIPEATPSKRLKVWSSACSSGEEPYSVAMTLIDSIPNIKEWDIKIYASDLSTKVLRKAEEGVYIKTSIQGIPDNLIKSCILKGTGANENRIKMKDQIRSMISFMHLNLMDPKYSVEGSLDLIFCRNVMIYFDKATQQSLIAKFFTYLKKGGFLFIGHSESLQYITHPFQYIAPTVYQKQ